MHRPADIPGMPWPSLRNGRRSSLRSDLAALLTVAFVASFGGVHTTARADDTPPPPPGVPMLPVDEQERYTDFLVGLVDSLRLPPRHDLVVLDVSHLHFAPDSTELDEGAKQTLNRVVRLLTYDTTVSRLIIRGHADQLASDEYNLGLGGRRAEVTRKYLLAQGVSPMLIHVSTQGEFEPVDESWTQAGRANNRRVEMYIIRRPVTGAAPSTTLGPPIP